MPNNENKSPLFKTTIIYALMICAVFFLSKISLYMEVNNITIEITIFFNILAGCLIALFINNSILRNTGEKLGKFIRFVIKATNVYIILYAIASTVLKKHIVEDGLVLLCVVLTVVAALLVTKCIDEIFKK